MSAYLFADAMYKGVLPKEFCAFTFALFDNNNLTTSTLLNQDARCKGVSFNSASDSIFAPFDNKSCTPCTTLYFDAMCKGVKLSVYFFSMSSKIAISFIGTSSFSTPSMYFIL